MYRRFVAITLLTGILLLLGCTAGNVNDGIVGTYIYEKEGFGGNFAISLGEDGKFAYYEGLLSSYYGIGEWSEKDGIITLHDDEEAGYGLTNILRFEDGALVYIADGSDGFTYVDVADGDRFLLSLPEAVE